MRRVSESNERAPSLLTHVVVLLLLVVAAVPWTVVLDAFEAHVLRLDVCGYTSTALPVRRPREFAALASAMDAGPPPRRLA
jgi:hypothetical protein